MGQGTFDAERLFLDKWEMYKALSSSTIDCKLPLTEALTESSLRHMLLNVEEIYVKPVNTWGGEGITFVTRVQNPGSQERLYQTKDSSGNQQSGSIDVIVHSILRDYADIPSIVQQSAPLLQLESAPFDVRVLMQREADGEWTYAGSLVRRGSATSIVSNIGKSGGTVIPLSEALRATFPLDKHKRRGVRGRCKQCGYQVCRILDGYHAFDEIGLDFGIDADGVVWLIEVNTNDALGGPSHELFLQLPDKELHRQIAERHRSRRVKTALSILEGIFE